MAAWYQDGLSFKCTGCGNCCTGGPGVVWVDKEEIRRIAEFIHMHPDDLWGPILRREGSRVTIVERPNFDCVFLKRTDDGRRVCGIYPIRPQQCRTWPFWSMNLRSRAAWDDAKARTPCPGMDNGTHYDFVQIETIRKSPQWYTLPEDDRDEAAE
ncbi:MAG: hypothetical protein BIFFINMI_00203 [Phycisphaerae bacterium]|nr:hypothetical protein [Phycisphaerae bacterium]